MIKFLSAFIFRNFDAFGFDLNDRGYLSDRICGVLGDGLATLGL
jgi:hypothetical protein